MASKTISQEVNSVSFVVTPYETAKELPFSKLAEDTLIIDVAELIRDASQLNVRYPVTAFQLLRYVKDELAEEISHFNYTNVLFLGIKLLFFDPNVLDTEYCELLASLLKNVREVSLSAGVEVLFVDFDEEYNNTRNIKLNEVFESSVDILFNSRVRTALVR